MWTQNLIKKFSKSDTLVKPKVWKGRQNMVVASFITFNFINDNPI